MDNQTFRLLNFAVANIKNTHVRNKLANGVLVLVPHSHFWATDVKDLSTT
jgi:hypothetical protein